MKHTIHFVLILGLAVLILIVFGCATIKTTDNRNREGAIQTTPRMIHNMDNANRTLDANISSAIRLKFAADELLSSSDINVDTTYGKVTLRGNVDTHSDANRAIQLGRSVAGVRSVHSSLTVKGTKTK
jgi:osmotically-inducible protein OsmY